MKIFDVNIENNTLQSVERKILDSIKRRRKISIVTLNPEILLKCRKNPRYKEIVNNASIRTIDGNGIMRLARIIDPKFTSGLATGTDLLYKFCEISSEKKIRLFFLGGEKDVAKRAASRAQKLWPGVHIVGHIDGIRINPQKINTEIIRKINLAKTNILFVALGAPKQEIWISKNIEHLRANVFIGVGGALDYLSGNINRSPKVLRSLGLEWLYRLIKQPSRLKRIFNAIVVFPFLAIFSNR